MSIPQEPTAAVTATAVGRRRGLLIASIVVVALVVAAGATMLVLRLTGSHSTASDSGRQACQMMADDKRSGSTPDQARSDQEIGLLRGSGNADLRKAADLLKSGDLSTSLGAVGPLYAGCQAVGVPIPN